MVTEDTSMIIWNHQFGVSQLERIMVTTKENRRSSEYQLKPIDKFKDTLILNLNSTITKLDAANPRIAYEAEITKTVEKMHPIPYCRGLNASALDVCDAKYGTAC